MTRLLIDSQMHEVGREIREEATYAGGSVQTGALCPSWTPNPDSQPLHESIQVYSALFRDPPEVESVHARVEASIIGARLETEELLSVGPTILYAHSPDEHIHIPSVANIFKFLELFVSATFID